MLKDGTYWAEQIRLGVITSQELLLEINQRVIAANPDLNAVVASDLEKAQEQLASGGNQEIGPFSGVPIPLKMLGQGKAGLIASSASPLFANHLAEKTDNFVLQLEKAGFIPFGQTNAPEFGFKNITDPKLYGVTKNVWNPDYHAGGSSGGAVSALASGMYPIVAASDGGGSIRIPASFSGVIGLKPSRGSMPTGPDGWRGWQGASINFGLTISMRDTESLFNSLRSNHKAAPYQNVSQEHSQPMPEKLRIAACLASPVNNPVSIEAQTAYREAIDFLIAQGHQVTEIPYPVDGLELITSYYEMNGAETVAMMDGIEASLGRSLVKSDMEPMTWAIYNYGKKLSAGEYVHSLAKWDQAAFVMETLFEDYELFLSPTATDTAPKISTDLQSDEIRQELEISESLSKSELKKLVYDMFEKSLAITPYTQLANLTGQPAISLPTYVAPNGLPIGIQFMASKGQEDLLFKIGKEFEEKQQFKLPKYYREQG